MDPGLGAGFEFAVLGQVGVDALPAAPALVTAVRVRLAPGAATQPFTAQGPVLIIVEDGTVSVDAELATVGLPFPAFVGLDIRPATPAPGTLVGRSAGEDEQIALPSGGTARLSNVSAEPVAVLVISIAPIEAATATPVP